VSRLVWIGAGLLIACLHRALSRDDLEERLAELEAEADERMCDAVTPPVTLGQK
jgi:hypothetical protein